MGQATELGTTARALAESVQPGGTMEFRGVVRSTPTSTAQAMTKASWIASEFDDLAQTVPEGSDAHARFTQAAAGLRELRSDLADHVGQPIRGVVSRATFAPHARSLVQSGLTGVDLVRRDLETHASTSMMRNLRLLNQTLRQQIAAGDSVAMTHGRPPGNGIGYQKPPTDGDVRRLAIALSGADRRRQTAAATLDAFNGVTQP